MLTQFFVTQIVQTAVFTLTAVQFMLFDHHISQIVQGLPEQFELRVIDVSVYDCASNVLGHFVKHLRLQLVKPVLVCCFVQQLTDPVDTSSVQFLQLWIVDLLESLGGFLRPPVIA